MLRLGIFGFVALVFAIFTSIAIADLDPPLTSTLKITSSTSPEKGKISTIGTFEVKDLGYTFDEILVSAMKGINPNIVNGTPIDSKNWSSLHVDLSKGDYDVSAVLKIEKGGKTEYIYSTGNKTVTVN